MAGTASRKPNFLFHFIQRPSESWGPDAASDAKRADHEAAEMHAGPALSDAMQAPWANTPAPMRNGAMNSHFGDAMPHFKLGRLARTYDPRIPHLSALLAGKPQIKLPARKDWAEGMPAHLGAMLNDKLGDCTCAAFYHALQLWSYNASGAVETQPIHDVEELYIRACGYNPAETGEGPGGNEQKVLTYLVRRGAPVGPYSQEIHKISAFVEVDPRNHHDVKRTILECGVAYIGLHVPAYLVPDPPAQPPKVWDVEKANDKIVGGHAVVLVGYTAEDVRLISWGQFYTMTWSFFAKYVDEVYALADTTWIERRGTTPGGLSLAQLESQMRGLNGS